jgi:hypothetical protein
LTSITSYLNVHSAMDGLMSVMSSQDVDPTTRRILEVRHATVRGRAGGAADNYVPAVIDACTASDRGRTRTSLANLEEEQRCDPRECDRTI